MKKFCGFFLLFIWICFSGFSQEAGSGQTKATQTAPSRVRQLIQQNHVIQDSRIDSLVVRHVETNKRKNGIEGYRLEIFFSSDFKAREKAQEVKTEFLKRFPNMEAYIQFQSPNFRVRVGNFRTKSEALQAQDKMKMYYPNAFRVDDIIQYPKLITEETEQ